MQQYHSDVLITGNDPTAASMRDSLLLHIKQEEGLMGKHCTDSMTNGYASLANGASPRDTWAYRDSLSFRPTPAVTDRTANLQNATNTFPSPTPSASSMDWGNMGRTQTSSQYYGPTLAQTNAYSSHASAYGWGDTHHSHTASLEMSPVRLEIPKSNLCTWLLVLSH